MKPRILPHILVVACALSLAACTTGSQQSPNVTTDPATPSLPVDHPPLGPDQQPAPSAAPQRFSVNQLRRSYPVALGKDTTGRDITWRMPDGTLGLDRMARSMGEPDFVVSTDEVLEVSPLYLKFADDAARSTCDQALKADAVRATMTDRVLMRTVGLGDTLAAKPQAVRDNLRYLKLRFHGVKIAQTDDAAVASLETLFDKSVKAAANGGTITSTHVAEGWRAVCVALLTAPEFHIY